MTTPPRGDRLSWPLRVYAGFLGFAIAGWMVFWAAGKLIVGLIRIFSVPV